MSNYKITIPKSIIPLLVLAIILNILRVVIWGKMSFVFIPWNIFLAFIPFIISSLLLSFSKKEKPNTVIFTLGFLLWFLFIPNAPYIITDFVHLGVVRGVPIMFDVFLLFSSALVGLILGLQSLSHIEQIIKMKYSIRLTSFLMGLIILMVSFGVYLGRFLRFNSWDIFVNHTSLIKNVWNIFTQSSSHIEVYLYTLLIFFFLYITYKSCKYLNIK